MRTAAIRALRRLITAVIVIGLTQSMVACAPRLVQPQILVAPYDDMQVWGVAPLINESGTTSAEVLRLTDSVQRALQETQGIDAVPVNRIIGAMRQLEIDRMRTVQDVRGIMRLLDLDGLIVGSITAYDPYRPMLLGLAFDLYLREDALRPSPRHATARALRQRRHGHLLPRQRRPPRPNCRNVQRFQPSGPQVARRLRRWSQRPRQCLWARCLSRQHGAVHAIRRPSPAGRPAPTGNRTAD
jgi:hypothetical protein